MISRKEAERILGKEIEPVGIGLEKEFAVWDKYVNILFFPEVASKVLTEEALFVVHGGYSCCYSIKSYARGVLNPSYAAYIRRLRDKIRSEIGKKSVVAWVEKDKPDETLELLGIDPEYAVLIPFGGGVYAIFERVVKMENVSFIRELSKYIKFAKLTGEFGDACVNGAETTCGKLIKTKRLDDCIYY